MKTDRRSRKTIGAIQNTVLQLMCSRHMNEIKIVDLCMAADINRTTFYLHFHNIAEVLESLIDEMTAAFENEAYGVNNEPLQTCETLAFLNACADVLDRYEYFGPFVQKSADADFFLTRLKNVLAKKINERIALRYGDAAENAKYVVRFLTGGVLDVYVEWLKSDKSPSLESVLYACAPMVSAGKALLSKTADEHNQQ